MADDYFKPRHATDVERAALDKALGRSMREVPDPEIAALESRVRELEAEREPLIHDLERHIAIAAREADERLKTETELESREPSKSQIKRISAMVESAEIKRLEAEVGRLRDAASALISSVDDHGGGDWPAVIAMRAALQGEGIGNG